MERKILVVDDEEPIRALLKSALSGPGIQIYEADSGAAALQVAIDAGPFSLVVSDVLMPGMDGIELARALFEQGYADRFLFMSGYCGCDTLAERVAGIGTSAYVGKPFKIPELLRAVRELTVEARAPSSVPLPRTRTG